MEKVEIIKKSNVADVPSIIKPEEQTTAVRIWTEDLKNLTKSQNFNLSQAELEFGSSIIYGLVDKCTKEKIDTRLLNTTNFLEQVKHFAKLQLSLQEQELFIDVRNDKNTGMKTIRLAKQYPGIQKLMMRFSTKKIVRFKRGVVCKGDSFQVLEDFDTGLTKILAHTKNEGIDRNKLENIEKAYAIAYVEEYGKLVPYTEIIDKKRIMDAYNASPSYDKNIWNTYTTSMVLKTALWSLYNGQMKPFIEIPADLKPSFEATEDKMEFAEDKVFIADPYDIPDNVRKIDNVEPIYDVSAEPVNIDKSTGEVLNAESAPTVQNEDGVITLDYNIYKENKDKYTKVNNPDGTSSFDKKTYTIKVRENK